LPAEAHKLLLNDNIVNVSKNEIKKGDLIIVKPGDKVQTDGIIIEDKTHINESMITGESNPIFKKLGSQIIGGSING